MPVFTDALIGDTTHLSTEEFGAYCLLLFATWRNNGQPFPDDDKRLSRICRVGPKRWRTLRPVLEPFFDISSSFWRQKRLEKEWEYVQRISASQSRNAKARWLKEKKSANAGAHANEDAKQMRNECPQTQTHYSEAKASAPDDPLAAMFDAGVLLLGRRGIPANRARALVGKWRKLLHDDGELLRMLLGIKPSVQEPVSYMEAAIANKLNGGVTPFSTPGFA